MKKRRCKAAIYKPDVPRYTGRGKAGYEMHYTKKQCSRAAREGTDFCGQHQGNFAKLDWHEFVELKTP